MFHSLKESPLFKNLESSEIENLLLRTPHQFKQFKNKEIIAFAGEKVERAMLLTEGTLRGEMLDFSGNRLKIEEMQPPHMIASAFLFGPNNTFPVNLSALSDGKLLVIYKKDFAAMLSQQPQVLNNFLNIISGKAQFLTQKITFLSLKTIREKIAFFLLQGLNKENLTVNINQNQTQLAGLMGVARPSLARTIGELEAENMIKWGKTQVSIVDPMKLKLLLRK
jgi:CRP-like cAMP-binding protein